MRETIISKHYSEIYYLINLKRDQEASNREKRMKKEKQLSILKEISPGISLEGMMLKLKLQYFGHLI